MLRYAIEHHPNAALVTIHVDRVLPQWLVDDWEQQDPSEETIALRDAINNVPGVVESYTHRLSVHIERGGAWGWGVVLPRLVEVLAEHFNETDCVRVEAYPRDRPDPTAG